MNILKRAWKWFDDRTGTSSAIGPIAEHPVPPGTDWWYVFGSATLFAFILQVVTGVILALAYVPSAGEAYQSLPYITNVAFMGSVLRGMHYFGASAMVLFVGVHMARVFLMGVYKFPREMSWLSGTVLLLLTLGAAFSGQLLRWDQNAIWTAVVSAEIAGRAPLIGNAIEEVLRYRSPVQSMFRVAKSDVRVGGETIPEGGRVVAWIGSANHDEEQFPHAEEFDIERSPNRHVAFGHGIHYCLGAPLARLEGKIALEAVLERFEGVELAPNTALERMPSNIVLGLKRLPMVVRG